MIVRVRIPSAALFWRRGRRKAAEALSLRDTIERRVTVRDRSEALPVISVTCTPGDPASGPKVAMGIKLAGKRGLLVEMNVEEASELANELLMAAQMSEHKYQLHFGTE